jgi:hypothetical protein
MANSFSELANAKLSKNRTAVISENISYGGITIAQKIEIEEGPKSFPVFIKGALHLDNLENLYNLREAITEAIESLEDKAVKESK